MEAVRKSNRINELVSNIQMYLEMTGSTTFTSGDICGDLSYTTVNPTLQRMRKRGMISIVGTIKQNGTIINVFKPIDLVAKPETYMPQPPEPIDCLGWREYFPEMFMDPNITGTTRVISNMKDR